MTRIILRDFINRGRERLDIEADVTVSIINSISFLPASGTNYLFSGGINSIFKSQASEKDLRTSYRISCFHDQIP